MRAVFLIAAVLVVALSPLAVYAQSQGQGQRLTEQFNKPMPKVDIIPKEEFDKTSNFLEEKFPEDPALNFDINIPKNYTDISKGGLGNINVSNKVLGELRKYYGPPSLSERSRLVVEAVGLDFTMTAEQWFIQYLIENGYNLQGLEVYDRNRAEALYVMIDKGVSYAVRSVARINGKRVIFVQHFVPIDRWHDEKVVQASILHSFHITHPVNDFVEEMEEYQFLDLAKFRYPVSWELRALPVRSIDRMRVELNNVAELEDDYGKIKSRLDGQIDVELVSIYASETLEEEIDRFRAELSERGMILGEVIENRDDFLLGDRFDFVDTQVFRVTNENSNLQEHELWLTIMSSGEYYYFVTLFTPSRDKDFFKWARNAEAYKLIVSLIEPEDDALMP